MIDWHRIFGLALTDLFTNSNYQVELEKDVSIQQQFLDVAIVEQTEGPSVASLPDGLDNLAKHNLLTYKSHQETLDKWTLKELVGYYIAYRKLVSPNLNHLRPEEEFRLYAASTRYPTNLGKLLTKTQAGVYEIEFCHPIRVLVLSQFPETPNNAFWQLFSANAEKVLFGQENYDWQQPDWSSVIDELFKHYQLEGIMSYTMADYVKEYRKNFLQDLSVEERLTGLSPDQRLHGLSSDQRLHGLSPDQRLQGLSPDEVLQRLSPDQRLHGLSPDEIEAYLSKLKTPGPH
jgi:hypothetical protein